MARKKLSEKDKKKEFSISVNEELYELMEQYMIDNSIKNRSRYIELLFIRICFYIMDKFVIRLIILVKSSLTIIYR
jgi:hypothetical protein